MGEALEVMACLFNHIFKGLAENCKKEIEMVNQQWNVEPFKWKADSKPLILTYEEGMELLRAAGSEIPDDISNFDMGTTDEKKLGNIIRTKYDTDFYMLIDFPQGIRPFYTHPNPAKPGFSRS